MRYFLYTYILQCAWLFIKHSALRKFKSALDNPRDIQASLLMKIVRKNECASFCKNFNFSSIRTVADYKKLVPILKFAELAPYLDRERECRSNELTSESPIFYTLTSGTTSKAKMIPVTSTMIKNHRDSQSIALQQLADNDPTIFSGKILTFMSPSIEGYTERQVPFGSMSGLLYERGSKIIASRYAIPNQVFSIKEFKTKQMLIALFSLASSPLTLLSAVNPLSIITYEAFVNDNKAEIIHYLQSGTLPNTAQVLKDGFNARVARFKSHVSSAIERLSGSSQVSIKNLYPNLRGVVCWTAGNCGYFAKKLSLPDGAKLYDAGYLSSEFRGTIVLNHSNPVGMPTIHENFFEFITPEDWDSGIRETLLIDEVTPGQQYFIIITTQGGLYRYFMNDIVEIKDSPYKTPGLSFIQKGGGVTNLTGEKIYESHILSAFACIPSELQSEVKDFIVIPSLSSQQYICYYESDSPLKELAEEIDIALMEQNIEYKAKRESGRLFNFMAKKVLPGTFEKRKNEWIKYNKREGQYKAPKLMANKDPFFDFSDFIEQL